MSQDPTIDLPLTEIPHTLVGVYPIGHIFYFEFPTEPGPEEYVAAGTAISVKMAEQIGQTPSSWIYRPTVEIRWGEIADNARTPIRVQ